MARIEGINCGQDITKEHMAFKGEPIKERFEEGFEPIITSIGEDYFIIKWVKR